MFGKLGKMLGVSSADSILAPEKPDNTISLIRSSISDGVSSLMNGIGGFVKRVKEAYEFKALARKSAKLNQQFPDEIYTEADFEFERIKAEAIAMNDDRALKRSIALNKQEWGIPLNPEDHLSLGFEEDQSADFYGLTKADEVSVDDNKRQVDGWSVQTKWATPMNDEDRQKASFRADAYYASPRGKGSFYSFFKGSVDTTDMTPVSRSTVNW